MLGQGRCAGYDAGVRQVLASGANDGDGIHPGVPAESRVLRGKQGELHVLADLVERDPSRPRPVLGAHLRQELVVPVEHAHGGIE